VYMGWLLWRSDPLSDDQTRDAKQWPARRQIIFALSVSLLNPHAILDTIGVIGTSSLAYVDEAKFAFTLACVLNSWLWFFVLAVVGRWVGSIVRVRRVMNRVSAIIMWLSAIYLVYNLTKV
ncbi:MAG TPA: LysE family transporter, partial [Anaerolineae bacterium]|nr:LysE family transporter [Anaerolineae bacterium]